MNNDIILTVRSITFAHKAKRILSRAGINATILKLDSNEAQNGCGYGILLAANDHFAAAERLRIAGIRYSLLERNQK